MPFWQPGLYRDRGTSHVKGSPCRTGKALSLSLGMVTISRRRRRLPERRKPCSIGHLSHETCELGMNETLELLSTRRSAPAASLAEPGPSPEELESLLKVGSRVPDHGKLVPWRYILFEGMPSSRRRDHRRRLCQGASRSRRGQTRHRAQTSCPGAISRRGGLPCGTA